jgi:hypothetical protein
MARFTSRISFPFEVGGEHFAGPVHQIVRFIHQESVVAAILGEVTMQIHLRIKNVVVVADDGVHPYRNVQGKFERTHLMFLAHGFENGAGDFSCSRASRIAGLTRS